MHIQWVHVNLAWQQNFKIHVPEHIRSALEHTKHRPVVPGSTAGSTVTGRGHTTVFVIISVTMCHIAGNVRSHGMCYKTIGFWSIMNVVRYEKCLLPEVWLPHKMVLMSVLKGATNVKVQPYKCWKTQWRTLCNSMLPFTVDSSQEFQDHVRDMDHGAQSNMT